MIRQRAGQFTDQWNSRQRLRESEHSEIFINEFFGVFDIDCYLSNIIFEYELPSKRRIDVFWPGVILIENKSPGLDLSEACRKQAISYYEELEDYLKPKYVLINNFRHFKIFSFKRRKNKANYWQIERSFPFNELSNDRNISLFYYFSDHKYVTAREAIEQPAEKIVKKKIYMDKSVDEKPLENLTKYEIKKFMHKIKYSILKLGMVSSIFFTLGYFISDGQPRAYLESVIEQSTREEPTR